MDHPGRPPLPRLRTRPADARRTPILPGDASPLLLAHGSFELRWWVRQDPDPQTPHDRDELYVVVAGTATFVRAEAATPFAEHAALPPPPEETTDVQPGDTLFVPAGTPHRFEHPSEDFAAWMIFYGPEGGEGW